jgi:hypothetical protein
VLLQSYSWSAALQCDLGLDCVSCALHCSAGIDERNVGDDPEARMILAAVPSYHHHMTIHHSDKLLFTVWRLSLWGNLSQICEHTGNGIRLSCSLMVPAPAAQRVFHVPVYIYS